MPPAPDARPLGRQRPALPVTIENPPGLYGAEDGVFAHNLLACRCRASRRWRSPQITVPGDTISYAFDELRDLKGPLVAAALALMVLDTPGVFWLGGVLARRPRPLAGAGGSDRRALIACGAARLGAAARRGAEDAKPATTRRHRRDLA